MPRKPAWHHRVPGILAELDAARLPALDRRTVQTLFQVSPRQALRLMAAAGAYPAGNSLVLDPGRLAEFLGRIQAGEDWEPERRRLRRLSDRLAEARSDLSARKIRIPAGRGPDPHITGLPSSIRLSPSRLEIDFRGAEELLSHLLLLSQAISQDYTAFEKLLQGNHP
jgi:hypothetical protein